MLQSKNTPAVELTVAYNASHKITLAGMTCPYCAHTLRAADVELLGDVDLRAICSSCHQVLLSIER